MDYPFQLVNAFFIQAIFSRKPESSGYLQFKTEAEIKVTTDNYPERLQVNIRIKTINLDTVQFNLELVGLFKYIGNNPDADKYLFSDYLTDRAIYLLWSYIVQFCRIVTGEMGIVPSVTIPPLQLVSNQRSKLEEEINNSWKNKQPEE